MLTDEEIRESASRYVENIGGEVAMWDIDSMTAFARAIEAKVRAEHVPKFKVGDKLELCGVSIKAPVNNYTAKESLNRNVIVENVFVQKGIEYCLNLGTPTIPIRLRVSEEDLIGLIGDETDETIVED